MKLALLALLLVSVPPPAIDRAAVIERLARFIERYAGNLLYVGQRGAVRGPGGYARWRTDAEARAALRRDLARKFGRGMSAGDVLAVWCDPRCNYAHRLERETAIDPETRWE